MESPLATETDSPLSRARQAHRDAEEACAKAWQIVEKKKRELEADGATETEVKALQVGEYADYEKKAAAATRAREEYVGLLEAKSGYRGIETKVPGGKVTTEFLDAIGGLKAFDASSGGATLPRSFYSPDISQIPTRQPVILDLIPVVQTGATDTVQYLRQVDAGASAAAPVSPGDVKPETSLSLERAEAKVTTIAHMSEPIERQLVSDFDAAVSFIEGQLLKGLRLATEDQVLNGSGMFPEVQGILGTMGLSNSTGPNMVEAVFNAIMALRARNFSPNAVALHPDDYSAVRLARDDSGAAPGTGAYLFGPPSQAGADAAWGVNMVVSTALTPGLALIGDFSNGAKIYDREQSSIRFTEVGSTASGDDLFERNLVRWRAESRIAFAVLAVDAFETASVS